MINNNYETKKYPLGPPGSHQPSGPPGGRRCGRWLVTPLSVAITGEIFRKEKGVVDFIYKSGEGLRQSYEEWALRELGVKEGMISVIKSMYVETTTAAKIG